MNQKSITVGIDASNITGGGGLKHLVEILRSAEPHESGVRRVIVWCVPKTAEYFPVKDWLELMPIDWFGKSICHRQLWRKLFLRKEIDRQCDVLFVPGGVSLSVSIPDVVMSQNMQPFLSSERAAAGFGKARLRVELLRFLQGWSFQKASGRLFLTDFAAKTIDEQFPFGQNNNVVIPHGIDPIFFCSYESRIGINVDDIKISYVSTLNTYKHQLEVIDALFLLSKKYPSLKLQLFGAEATFYGEKVKKRIAEVNAEADRDLISYFGKVSFDALPEIYKKSDVVVFASSCENLPNILLEAMAASSPVVCSEFPPMPSILKGAGLYCDVKSPESIAEAIDKFIQSDRLREEKGSAANSLASRYSWPVTSKLTFDFLAKTAKSYCEFIEE